MKIIHTGDWHIGKIVNQVHMTEDQEVALNSLVSLLKVEKPDVLIIAGDIYDRAIPPVEAVELLDRILSEILLDLKIPVLIVAGNHDNPERLGFGSKILQARGLYIEGRFRKEARKVVLEDGYGLVNFYLVPYAVPAVVRNVLARDDISNHDEAMGAIVEIIKADWNPEERNIMVTHGFVRGIGELEISESEKPLSYSSIGGADYVDVNKFKDFAYTALGHLHSPQKAGYEKVRYAGSLLKYSFSEVNQKKSVTCINLEADGSVEIRLIPLSVRRDMRRIKGELKALLDPAVYKDTNVEDYLHVVLTDEGGLMEPMVKLRSVYPNVLSLEIEAREPKSEEINTSAGEGYKHQSKLELFKNFYCDITGMEFDEKKEKIVVKVIEEAEGEERRM
ncbi:MAG: exonuclease SbcCD subunit D [Eubacteriales bacterium]